MTYTLLALSGLAPQVVTEAAWSLARQHTPPLAPDRVEVVATGAGEAVGRALLLGEPARDPVTGAEIDHRADRWTPFCHDTFGHPVPLAFHVPTAGGQPLADVTGVDADRRFADVCYALVARLTRPGTAPLIGSLAGGRKTLSAHLMTAFAVCARPQDRLIHLIVHPASAERDPTFFHPHPGSDARVHRVDVPFPRLRPLLADGPAGDALAYGADLRALLATLQPHLAAEQTPDALTLTVSDGHATLSAVLRGAPAATARLTPAQTATLVVVAEAIAEGRGSVRLDALAESRAVEQGRRAALAACGRDTPLAPWTTPSDVSKAVSRLNAALAGAPLVARFASVESDVRADATWYRWAEPPPHPITVTPPPPRWPFRHIPAARAQPAP